MYVLVDIWFFKFYKVCSLFFFNNIYSMLTRDRAWCYEAFVHLHIILGVGYVGLMFWHCANMLTSVRIISHHLGPITY